MPDWFDEMCSKVTEIKSENLAHIITGLKDTSEDDVFKCYLATKNRTNVVLYFVRKDKYKFVREKISEWFPITAVLEITNNRPYGQHLYSLRSKVMLLADYYIVVPMSLYTIGLWFTGMWHAKDSYGCRERRSWGFLSAKVINNEIILVELFSKDNVVLSDKYLRYVRNSTGFTIASNDAKNYMDYINNEAIDYSLETIW